MTNLKPCWSAPPSVGRVTPCPMSAWMARMLQNVIRELRNLLDAFNEAKKTAGLTLVKMLVTGLVLALLAGTIVKIKLFGGPQ